MDQNCWARYYPSFFDLESIDQQSSIPKLLDEAAERFGESVAFSQDGKAISYLKLKQLSEDWAACLQGLEDLVAGDRVLIQLPNSLAFPVVFYGSLRAELIVVPSNPLYTKRELVRQLQDSGARVWVTTHHHAAIFDDVCAQTDVRHVFVSDIYDFHSLLRRWLLRSYLRWQRHDQVKGRLSNRHRSLARALQLGRRRSFEPRAIDADQIALLQYTGGSSGRWKGAMLKHRNIIANMKQLQAMIGDGIREQQELIVAALPLYHIFSLNVHCVMAVASGNHVSLVLDPTRIDRLVSIIEKSNMSTFAGLTPIFHSLLRHPRFKQLKFPNLRFTISGGMALSIEIAKQWEAQTDCQILEGFGMSETSPVVTLNPPSQVKYGSIGVPVPGTEIRLVNDLGELVHRVGETGELEVRGPQVMAGYWQQAEESREQLSPDGWLKTGDLASIDRDGFVSIVGRKKRMIIVSGFNVYPQEVEEVLREHPSIVSAKVTGTPHRITGETIRAEVLARKPLPDPAEIRRFCKERLAPYKVPRTVTLVEASSLPQAAGGN